MRSVWDLGLREDRGFIAAAHPPGSFLCAGWSVLRPIQGCPRRLDLLCCRESVLPHPSPTQRTGGKVFDTEEQKQVLQHQGFPASSQPATIRPRGALMYFSENRGAQLSWISLTSSRSGPAWTSWGSTRPSARSWTWVGTIPGVNTGWGMKGLKIALRRRTWG